MKVPLLDLQAQYRSIRGEIEDAVGDVFLNQQFIMGPRVVACEEALARYCACRRAVGVSSGTDALLVALMAEGIGPGHEVITTPYTFFATVGSIVRSGARPVFADIDPVTFNIDPDQVAARITPRTRAIIPVHLFGRMAAMDPLLDLAQKHRLVVIEDACQAIGAEDRGRRAGSLGDYGCFSFFPSKNLGGAGDGGLVTTRDDAKAARVARLRNHGMEPKYYHHELGGNFRLDALQAAVIAVKLPHLDTWTAQRQANARRYEDLFAAAGLASAPVLLPVAPPPGDRHVYNQYVIRVPRRDALRQHLQDRGIGCEVYYPVPLHLQPCFAPLGHKPGDFPASERAALETLALPIYPELTAAQAETVVAAVVEFYRR